MANYFLRSRPTTAWAAVTSHGLGVRRIKLAGNFFGIHFEVTTGGTTGAAEPAWNTTVGGTTIDGGVTWTTRGSADTWVALRTYVAGDRAVSTVAATAADQVLVQECTTGGVSGSTEPDWNNTVGGTTTDGTCTWTTREATTWNNAHIFITNLTASTVSSPAAGDTIFVGDEHNETSAAQIICNLRGSGSSITRMLCVNDTGDPSSPSQLNTTAVIANTGANILNVTSNSGSGYINGVTFRSGVAADVSNIRIGSVNSTSSFSMLENCSLILNTTSAGSSIAMGNVSATAQGRNNVIWKNVSCTFGSVSQSIDPRVCNFKWIQSSTPILGSVPTTLIIPATSGMGVVELESVDFSAIVAGNRLLNVSNSAIKLVLRNCRLGSGGNRVSSAFPGTIGKEAVFIGVESDNSIIPPNTLQFSYFTPNANQFVEESINVRSGGATTGELPFAWEAIISSGASFVTPAISFPIRVWNIAVGSPRTAVVEIMRDSLTSLTDAEVWLEIEYLGTLNSNISSVVSDGANNVFSTPVTQTSSTATWNTTGLVNPNRQKLEVTFTPRVVGLVTARVYIAIPSTSIFIDPFITLS